MRKSSEINLVPKWEENKSKGLCPVCGKKKEQFESHRKIYCSEKCSEEYSNCFLSWSIFKDRFLKQHGYFCDACKKEGKINSGELHVDHIKAIINGGEEFNKNNLQVLCLSCHYKKTKVDMIYKRTRSQNLDSFKK